MSKGTNNKPTNSAAGRGAGSSDSSRETSSVSVESAPADIEEKIRQRAYQLWLERGGGWGSSEQEEDWLQAERELRGEVHLVDASPAAPVPDAVMAPAGAAVAAPEILPSVPPPQQVLAVPPPLDPPAPPTPAPADAATSSADAGAPAARKRPGSNGVSASSNRRSSSPR